MECAKKFGEQAIHVHLGYQETVDYQKRTDEALYISALNFSLLFLLELFVRLVIVHSLCS